MENKKPKSLTEAIEHLESLTTEHVGTVGKNVENIVGDLKKTLEDLRPYVEDLESKARTKITDTTKQVKEKIQKDPWIVVVVVAVIGMIIGLLLFRNREEK